jgi:uncharacterized protein (UPF0335 family)
VNTDSLWTRIKQSVRESAVIAAEKAEHLGRVGRARLDIAESRHAIREVFTDLGGSLYDHIQAGGEGAIEQKPEVRQLVDRIRALEAELKAREGVLDALRAAANTDDRSSDTGA